MNEPNGCFMIIGGGLIVGLLIGFISAITINKNWQQDAIANGVGTYIVTEHGGTQFTWKEITQ